MLIIADVTQNSRRFRGPHRDCCLLHACVHIDGVLRIVNGIRVVSRTAACRMRASREREHGCAHSVHARVENRSQIRNQSATVDAQASARVH